MSNRKTIAKNAAVMMGSQVITWGLTLLLTIFLPRYLGPAAVGKFHFATSAWAIITVIAAFGMDTLLTKEIARHPELLAGYVWNSVAARLTLFGLGFIAMAAFVHGFNYPTETIQVVYIMGAATLFWLLSGAFQSALQGLERMEFNSLGMVLSKLVNTVLCIVLLLFGQGVLVIAAVGGLAAGLNLLVLFLSLRRLHPLPIQFHLSQMRQLMRAGFPYLMSAVFLVIYMQFDIVILSLLVNDQAVGWYGAADQLFGTLLFVPTVLMTAVFPVISRQFISDPDGMRRTTRKSFDLSMLLSIPIGLGTLVVANQVVVLLFGPEFAPSGPILALMGLVLILTYLNVFLGQFLISMDRQNQWTVVMAVATLATLFLDLWLIPLCQRVYANGGIGGAISFIITEAGMMIAGFWLLPAGTLSRQNGWMSVRTMLAGLLMTAVIWPIRDQFIAIPVAVGALVYLALVWLLHLVPHEDITLVKDIALNAMRRLHRAA